ncbi:MAG TPA: hypothetical protein VK071_13055 [Tissierellales bacterium]|nr:hypothetical protein [Tissierellales bacterium]
MDRYDLNSYIAMGIGMGISNITYRGINSMEVDTTMGIVASGGKEVKEVLVDEGVVGTNKGVIRDGSHIDKFGKLKPNSKYQTGEYEYLYGTEELGIIHKFEAEDLKLTKRKEGYLITVPP